MTKHQARAFNYFKSFCESVWLDWVQAKITTEQANIEIEEKRAALESRWGVKLPVYRIA